jgi:hypothetical protein
MPALFVIAVGAQSPAISQVDAPSWAQKPGTAYQAVSGGLLNRTKIGDELPALRFRQA